VLCSASASLSRLPIVAEVLLQVSNLLTSGQSVVLCRAPGHCGLHGKDATDASARAAAVHGPLVSDRALGTDVCSCLCHAILSSWQADWDNALGNRLRMVKPSVQEWQSAFRALRTDEVTPRHLRVSHTLVTRGAGACLHTLRFLLPWYMPWRTALVTPKPAVSVTLTA
jgi:hypothetical protein